ncbi:tyrosine-type recombinase/integrase [Microbispora rosea]|uniref:tyrosine-type recombinase/integrase n=1 Tax=Microbispora rosea TaxID=58117 RepID=UPI0036B92041
MTVALLFSGPNGGALHRNTFNHTWHVGLERAGIVPPPAKGERRKSHRDHGCRVLRHTAASAWLGAGVDIRTVAEYLGHSDPGFTPRTYTHLMPNAADQAWTRSSAQEQTGWSVLVVPLAGSRDRSRRRDASTSTGSRRTGGRGSWSPCRSGGRAP